MQKIQFWTTAQYKDAWLGITDSISNSDGYLRKEYNVLSEFFTFLFFARKQNPTPFQTYAVILNMHYCFMIQAWKGVLQIRAHKCPKWVTYNSVYIFCRHKCTSRVHIIYYIRCVQINSECKQLLLTVCIVLQRM
jgi:hypothetical protein